MRPVNSQVLQDVARILQLSGSSSGAQRTEFEDGILQQTFDVMGAVRRGGTVADTSGIYTLRVENTHIGTDTITTTVNPYTAQDAAAALTFIDSTWPTPVPKGFDVWLLSAYAQGATGTGDFSSGFLSLIYDVNAMAMRNDDTTGIAVHQKLCFWNTENQFGTDFYLNNGLDGVLPAVLQKPVRIRRSADVRINFQTRKTGAGAGTYLLFATLGLFPSGLGQDAE